MKTKLLIFPSILLFTFIIAYFTLDYFNNRNQLLISKTKDIYMPGIELSINLHNKLTATKRSFQDIVASDNELILERTDSIAESFVKLCAELNKKPDYYTFTDSILFLYHKYYKNARLVSKKMLEEDFSETVHVKIILMHTQYSQVESLIIRLKNNSKKQADIQKN